MSAPQANHRKRKILIASGLTGLLAFVLIFGGPYLYGQAQVAGGSTTSKCTMPNGAQGTFDATTGSCISFTVTIHNNDILPNVQMLAQGFAPSWPNGPLGGITYTLDPSPLITSEGHQVEQCDIFDTTVGGFTCEWGVDVPSVIFLSTSTNTITGTDTNAGSTGPCYQGLAGVITTGGLADIAGTVTGGSTGSTVTTTIAHTFTAAETDTAVQATCLKTETNSGSHIYLYAEGLFGPDTLVSGNTIAITWTIART